MKMGKSESSKQRRQQAKRKAALEKKRAYAQQCAEADLFPEIRIEPWSAPAMLVDAVRRAAKQIRLEHATLFHPAEREFYRVARRYGFGAAETALHETVGGQVSEDFRRRFRQQTVIDFGQKLYDLMPKKLIEEAILFDCIEVAFSKPVANTISIWFRSLLRVKTSGGTAYYSPRKPRLRIDGQERIVCFSRHAIERIYERSVYDWRKFGGSGDAFCVVDNCVCFDDCSEQVGFPCFTFYNTCKPGLPYGELPALLLGEGEPAKRAYYRIGYCPAIAEGDFVKAKTLLFPGMRGTPERQALDDSAVPRHQKRRMAELAESLDYRKLAEEGDYSLIHWFHEHGVPQVVALDREVFDFKSGGEIPPNS
jgi:hypothetical protein